MQKYILFSTWPNLFSTATIFPPTPPDGQHNANQL